MAYPRSIPVYRIPRVHTYVPLLIVYQYTIGRGLYSPLV
jgi:hypothetical protein